MTKASIRDALLHNPAGATIRMADGSRLAVPHPDYLSLPGDQAPETASAILWKEGGGFTVIALDSVVAVDVPPKK